MEGARPVRAARGTELTARQWSTEAPLRMLQNNLDPENAERPDDLVVYGGTGRAARDWRSYDAMVRTLTTLAPDETMLVQSGRPVGVFRTHEWAPRVLIANSNLVPDWANWPEFRRLEHMGLTMYGQMTAGSWIYIGTQGIVQGTYETFAAIAEKRYGGTLAGTITLTGGCGGMGGAQPLAVTLNGGVCIIADVDKARLERRHAKRYLDTIATDLDDAITTHLAAVEHRDDESAALTGHGGAIIRQRITGATPVQRQGLAALHGRFASLTAETGWWGLSTVNNAATLNTHTTEQDRVVTARVADFKGALAERVDRLVGALAVPAPLVPPVTEQATTWAGEVAASAVTSEADAA